VEGQRASTRSSSSSRLDSAKLQLQPQIDAALHVYGISETSQHHAPSTLHRHFVGSKAGSDQEAAAASEEKEN
jgi:hypothetical protein